MSDLHAWFDRQQLDERRVRELIRGEAVRRWGERHVRLVSPDALVAQLQLSDDYPRIRDRAAHKRRELAARGLSGLPAAIGLGEPDLWSWWETRDPGFAAYPSVAIRARSLGFANAELFRSAVIDEYHYITRCHLPDDGRSTPGARSLGVDDIITEELVQ